MQPQVDIDTHQIYGYEALLRKSKQDGWTVPTSFLELSVADQAKLIEATIAELGSKITDQFLAFNLNRAQFSEPETLETILKLQKKIIPVRLAIELTETPTLSEMQRYSEILHAHDMKLDLDDVGTDNTYADIKAFLPYADKIKFAMQNFRMNGTADQIPKQLDFWVQQARKYDLTMILEGVEDENDQKLAAKYGINIHQGYLYSKPVLPSIV